MNTQACLAKLQYIIPQHSISKLLGWLCEWQHPAWLKNWVIKTFVQHYHVDMLEAENADPCSYPSFNAFFTRALKSNARTIAETANVILSPVDGAVSQYGKINNDKLIQAKGHDFSVTDLLGGNNELAKPFINGEFATLYLSPKDYHRIHMPFPGTLTDMIYIPGKLFAVNPTSTNHIPNLFARNERVVCLFDTDIGRMAVIMVGALIVGSIETVWAGTVAPSTNKISHYQYDAKEKYRFAALAELGRFKLGSTVILLFPENSITWQIQELDSTNLQLGNIVAKINTLSI